MITEIIKKSKASKKYPLDKVIFVIGFFVII
ncbi:hypothetical protein G314FT_18900 [Vagococcus luciliae]|uniref:Uncharacterized protein n=1 Tax=Vagococcus luciliae TaxID=2920380 RepID=A0ABY5P1A9_9ENTE|nr:hypothetical protein G314FT_18900 [Vagococcus luciliae]